MRTRPPRAALRAAGIAVVAATTVALIAGSLGAPVASAVGPQDPPVRTVSSDQAAERASWRPSDMLDKLWAGKVHRGLRDSERCPGGFEVEHTHADGMAHPHCSHGPDPAPAGVDVRDVPTVRELEAQAAVAAEASPGAVAEAGAVPCYGDGVSGKRIQAIYAVAADRTDRYSSVVDLIRGYAFNADLAFANSAARDGGIRHLRWVTDGACRLSVEHVVLSPTGDDSIANTRTELRSLGYTSNDRKYLVFADAAVYCGIAYTAGDSRPDASNPANSGATVARVDAACWGGTTSVPAHEIAHTLGAVQLQAPHSNGAWHCTDEYDRLCYNDGSGAQMSYLCASSQEPLLDCNGDDYFNVAPAPGSWLATHWNLASSAFLESTVPTPPAPSTSAPPTTTSAPAPTGTSTTTAPPPPSTTTAAPPPTTTTTAAPRPTTTTTTAAPPPTTTATPTSSPSPSRVRGKKRRVATEFTGSLTSVKRSRTFRVVAQEGAMRSGAHLRGAKRIRLLVRDASGDVVVRTWVRSGSSVVRSVDGGRYRVTLRGREGTRFTLRVVRSVSAQVWRASRAAPGS